MIERAVVAAILLCVPVTGYAQFNCSQPAFSGSVSGQTINVSAGSGWQGPVGPSSLLDAAIQYWSVCTQIGSGFPNLCVDCGSGYPVTVHFVNGEGPRCGVHERIVSGGVPSASIITLFASAQGQSCEPVADSLAHELGHVLGLADVSWSGSCYGSIMGGRNPGQTRSVTGGDCSQVDENWTTPREGRMEQCINTCATTCDSNGFCSGGQTPWNPCNYCFDPLVLDLNGDGVRTTGAECTVEFDLDADGNIDVITWISAEDALLWTDLNGNNRVDDGRELFGVGTILPDGTRARHGFEALALYDRLSRGGDGNGRIDAEDEIWNRLRLWRDENHDGVCDPNERAPIHRYGVIEISLQRRLTNWTDENGTLHQFSGTYRKRLAGAGALTDVDHSIEALALGHLQD